MMKMVDDSKGKRISRQPKGFVMWASEAKDSFYWTDGKEVFRSVVSSVADAATGYHPGRWESTVTHWNAYADAFHRVKIPV